MKRLKVSRAAVAVSTAVLMTSTLLTPVTSASGANRINLSPDKTIVKPGDRLSLSVDYVPSDSGVAGFTIDVRYDPSQMNVFVPSDDMSASSAFSVITNTDTDTGSIRIIGSEQGGSNVSDSTHITTLMFDIKNNLSAGDLKYWIDVENMVCDSSAEYINADYSVPTESAPVSVKVDAPPAAALNSTEGELIEILPDDEDNDDDTEELKAGEGENGQTAVVSKVQDEGITYEKPAVSEHIYSYNESGNTQYVFNVSDYTKETSGKAKVEVVVASDKTITGAIGLGATDGSWNMYEGKSSGDAIWTADVDLASLNGTGAVQFFSVPSDTDAEIKSITVTPYDSTPVVLDATLTADDAEDTKADDAENKTEDTKKDTDEKDSAANTSDDADKAEKITADTKEKTDTDDSSDNTRPASAQSVDNANLVAMPTTENGSKETAGQTKSASDTAEAVTASGSAQTDDKAQAVTEKVSSAAAQADANPKTGAFDATNVIKFILIMLSTCVLVYSACALAINKLVLDKKTKAAK